MGATSPDNLPWPPGYAGVPADVPNDLQKLAQATQTALNKKATPMVGSTAALAPNTGFAHDPDDTAALVKFGPIIVCRGKLRRTANLGVSDNGLFLAGTIPAAYRPNADVVMAGAWTCLNTGLTPDKIQYLTVQINALTTGQLQVVSNINGILRAGTEDFISLGGLTWITST